MYIKDRAAKEQKNVRALPRFLLEEIYGKGQPRSKQYPFLPGAPMPIPDLEGYQLLKYHPDLQRVDAEGNPVSIYDFTGIKYNQKKQIALALGYEWSETLVGERELEELIRQKFYNGADPIILEEYRNGCRNNN